MGSNPTTGAGRFVALPMQTPLWVFLAQQADQPQWKIKDAVKFVEGLLAIQKQKIAYDEPLTL